MKLILSLASIICANIICEAGIVKEHLEEESKIFRDTPKLQEQLQEFMKLQKPNHFSLNENEKQKDTNIYRDAPRLQLQLMELMSPQAPNALIFNKEESNQANEEENASAAGDENVNDFLLFPDPDEINYLLNSMDSQEIKAVESNDNSKEVLNNEENNSDLGLEEHNRVTRNEPSNERCLLGTKGCNIHCLTKGRRYGRCKHGKCHCY